MKKKIDLSIYTKNAKKVHEISIHRNLPRAPFYLNIFALGNSGKSLLVVNVVHKFKLVFKKGNVIVYTNSYDPTIYLHVESRDANVLNSLYDKDDENILEQILKYQKETKRTNRDLENLLIIFDDFVTNQELNKGRSGITKLYTSARHFQISVIFCSQSYSYYQNLCANYPFRVADTLTL